MNMADSSFDSLAGDISDDDFTLSLQEERGKWFICMHKAMYSSNYFKL